MQFLKTKCHAESSHHLVCVCSSLFVRGTEVEVGQKKLSDNGPRIILKVLIVDPVQRILTGRG